jgi:hypothetical protein
MVGTRGHAESPSLCPGSCYRKRRRLIASMATLIAPTPTLARHKMAGSGPRELRVCGRLTCLN